LRYTGAVVRLHPRAALVRKASADLRMWLAGLQSERGLTDAELLSVPGDASTAAIRSLLRIERHPDDPSRKADEE
jgi:hypothetical protein